MRTITSVYRSYFPEFHDDLDTCISFITVVSKLMGRALCISLGAARVYNVWCFVREIDENDGQVKTVVGTRTTIETNRFSFVSFRSRARPRKLPETEKYNNNARKRIEKIRLIARKPIHWPIHTRTHRTQSRQSLLLYCLYTYISVYCVLRAYVQSVPRRSFHFLHLKVDENFNFYFDMAVL